MANQLAKFILVLAAVIGFSAIGSVINFFSIKQYSIDDERPVTNVRRSLLGIVGGSDKTYPWARNHLRPIDAIPDPDRRETVLFWNIPKSGGSSVKGVYECMGQTLAHAIGVDPRFGHQNKNEIVTFQPWNGVSPASYVNVDVTSKWGINRAKRLGLVQSGVVNMIITSDVVYAVENLFDSQHKGRVLAIFRHPIDRLVSKFFYLREATWEEQYRPQWKNMGLLEFAKQRNSDNNHLVKKLAGLGANETATESDFASARRTIKKRFIVGLTDQMKESVHRFNIVMGINETEDDKRQCMDHFFRGSVAAKRKSDNENPHKVAFGSATWNAFAKRNALDMKLYEYILEVFEEQRDIINVYTS